MAAQQQQGGQGGDNSLGFLWIIIGIFTLVLLIWYFLHPQIVSLFLKIKLFEISLVSIFSDKLAPLQQIIYRLADNPGAVPFSDLQTISVMVGKFFRFPVAIILGALALYMFFGNPILKYKKTYSMETLLGEEAVNWPQVQPVVKLKLIDTHIEKGEWAMAITPMKYAKKHDLLIVEENSDPTVLGSKSIPKVTLKEAEANELFAMQLGQTWQGLDAAPPYMRALIAVFAARANHNRKPADKLLMQMATTAAKGKPDTSGADAVLKKYYNTKVVQAVFARHAYTLTAMASLLALARTDGVLASADFLWLKPVDRPLWFMLNAVGRQTSTVEVAGPFAHWKAELDLGRKLYVPMIHQATKALEEAVQEIIYKPDEAPEGAQAEEG